MLPMLAMLVAGYMARQRAGAGAQAQPGGGLADVLGGMLGGGSAIPGGTAPGGLGSLLDLNRDGNPLDDILGMAGKLMR
jgi:hypothetical protein